MSKKLLSALIASLFTAAPAFGQSADDPMRVQGTATLGGIYNNTSARDKAQIDLYQDLGKSSLSQPGQTIGAATFAPSSTSFDDRSHLVRAKLNVKFGWDGPSATR